MFFFKLNLQEQKCPDRPGAAFSTYVVVSSPPAIKETVSLVEVRVVISNPAGDLKMAV
jgi:hypothetical protein